MGMPHTEGELQRWVETQLREKYGTVQAQSVHGELPVDDYVAPTLLNSWANYGSGYTEAGYTKDRMGFVHLQGTLTGGTPPSAAFTLPAGYRPVAACVFADGVSNGRIEVQTDGDVQVVVGDPVSLHDVTFKAVA